MNSIKYLKKPKTDTSTQFFNRVFPTSLFERLNKSFGIDANKEKTIFRSFCLFIVIVMIMHPGAISLRDLKAYSETPSIQLHSGQQSLSHTPIADILKELPSDCENYVLESLVDQFKL